MTYKPVLVQTTGKESGNRWELVGSRTDTGKLINGDWIYHFNLDGINYRLKIPEGFKELDGASVPRLLKAILKMGGREMPDEAWIPHDYLYHTKGEGVEKSLGEGKHVGVAKVSRAFADKMFYSELTKVKHGLSSYKPWMAYAGVRLAFWRGW
jgi:hypothetical protein